jgi:endonuclease YncB( thermonuclease family)
MGKCFSCCSSDNLDKKLSIATFETIPTYSLEGTFVPCKILKIYDGDTLWLAIYIHNQLYKYKCRMLGYDSPEMKPPLKQANREDEIKAAKASKEYLENLLKERYIKVEFFGYCKYGRPLINLYIYTETVDCFGRKRYSEQKCVNEIMISKGYGYPYDGGKKKDFSNED